MRYGVRSDLLARPPIHHLDIGEDIEELVKFPEGLYN